MAKRSFGQFERKPRDWYPTPAEAVRPLLRFLPPATRFAEPCAGDGTLIRHLEAEGHACVDAGDIHPMADGIRVCKAEEFRCDDAAIYVTNPPFAWGLLTPIITNLMAHRPTWLLLESDWAHNRRTAPFMLRCSKIVSVGRVRWEQDSKHTGKQNFAWYCFDERLDGPTEFFGRAV